METQGQTIVVVIAALAVIVFLVTQGTPRDFQVPHHWPISQEQYEAIESVEPPRGMPLSDHPLLHIPKEFFYRFEAGSGKEMRQAILKAVPQQDCIRKECSWTFGWNILWKWQDLDRGGTCKVLWANSVVRMNYHVPLWLDEGRAPVALQQRYGQWMDEIWERANDATLIVLQEAAGIERRIMTLEPMPCAQLDRRIKAEGFSGIRNVELRLAEQRKNPSPTTMAWMDEY
ncbi:MAG: DUF922 domain-containing protein [Pseudomonadota bacterium]